MKTAHQLSSPASVRVSWKPGTLQGLICAYLEVGVREALRGYVIAFADDTVSAAVYVTPDTLDTVEEKFETEAQAKAWVEAMLIACQAMER